MDNANNTNAGIPEARIANYKDHEAIIKRLNCSICHSILWKPKTCSKCRNNFCEYCIDKWTQAQNKPAPNCPFRCHFVKTNPDPLVNLILSDLKIKCIHAGKGCKAELPYDTLEIHEKSCIYLGRRCVGCNAFFLNEQIRAHERNCGEVCVLTMCCEKEIKRKEVLYHSELECFQARVKRMKEENTLLHEELKKTKVHESTLQTENDLLRKEKIATRATSHIPIPASNNSNNISNKNNNGSVNYHRIRCTNVHVVIHKGCMMVHKCMECGANVIHQDISYQCKADGFARFICSKCF
jgi:hypothetical protein